MFTDSTQDSIDRFWETMVIQFRGKLHNMLYLETLSNNESFKKLQDTNFKDLLLTGECKYSSKDFDNISKDPKLKYHPILEAYDEFFNITRVREGGIGARDDKSRNEV